MATRQYIGARYVPKFYQNSVDGSTQWESNVVYEPLMYVTLTNGHMYISKKQVPATVGSPVSNIDYWLDIGSYNGFIEQLQDEIDVINNTTIPAVQADVALKQNITDNSLTTTDKTVVGAINELVSGKQDKTDNTLTTTDKTVVGAINELNSEIQNKGNKRYIIITDSYGGYRDANSNRLVDLIGDAVDADANDRFVYGGVGFTDVNGVGTFLSALQAETISNPNTVTDIVVIGGQNDYGRVADDITAGIVSFINYCKTTFPNALVSIANATKSRCLSAVNPSVAMISGVISSYYACLAYRGCINYGARYLQGTEYIMHNAGLYEAINSPHPNASGVKTLANKIIEAIKTGSCSVYYSSDYDLTAVSGSGYTVTVPSAGFLSANVIDGVTQINVSVPARRFTLTFDTPTHMIDGAFTIAEPSDQTALLALGQTGIPWGLSLAVEAYCNDSSDNYLHSIPGWIHVGDNGELICTLQRGITENSNNIKTADIVVKQTVASYQSILC